MKYVPTFFLLGICFHISFQLLLETRLIPNFGGDGTRLGITSYNDTGSTALTVAPPTQGTWRSDDYVSAFRLVDAWLFYGVGRWTIIYILGGRHKHVRPFSPSHPNITFPLLVVYLFDTDLEYLGDLGNYAGWCEDVDVVVADGRMEQLHSLWVQVRFVLPETFLPWSPWILELMESSDCQDQECGIRCILAPRSEIHM